jgi:hypothetical protein
VTLEMFTLEAGALKLKALIAGSDAYVRVALLAFVSTAPNFVDVTAPPGPVAALTV